MSKVSVYICNNINYNFKYFISHEQNISKIDKSTNESLTNVIRDDWNISFYQLPLSGVTIKF